MENSLRSVIQEETFLRMEGESGEGGIDFGDCFYQRATLIYGSWSQ